ncbi:MAG: phosphoglycerate kinase [Candidatus Vogelbacteria bacterium]|nr:phosphoglycerate kinase [Candidatus Vogelbacteria bacterium]
MLSLKSIQDLSPQELQGKQVLVRLDLDVPITNGKVTEEFRLRRALPTVQYLKDAGAKIVVVGHIGGDGEKSLAPVAEWLRDNFDPNLQVEENLRRDPGEMGNDPAFAEKLAALGEIYVNDAFATCHREHASIVGVPKLLPSYAGLNLIREVEQLSAAFAPEHPFLFILGGVKFSTKAPLVSKFLKSADQIFIGGALANNFFKARGDEVGESLVDENWGLVKSFLNESKIILPIDTVISDKKILDIGSKSVEELKKLIAATKFVLWNGPLGNFEVGFGQATEKIARAIAQSGIRSIVGGGDTVTAIEKLNLLDRFGFVSTGGGAMLDFLARGTLPGLEALKK